jgi:hypothetical protein
MMLVAGQVALALSLLIGAGLLTRSFGALMSTQQFDPRHVAQLRLRPLLMGYDHERAVPYLHRALQSIRATPGVISAAPVRGSLVSQVTGRVTVALPDDVPSRRRTQRGSNTDVGPDWRTQLACPARRSSSPSDDSSAPLVAMVNHLWQNTWPNCNVGQPAM